MSANRPDLPPVRIPVYRGGAAAAHAVVDAEDAHLAEQRWRMHPKGYAQGDDSTLLHREVLGLSKGDGIEVDHENRNKLDCRRCNLRILTHAENRQNNDPGGNRSWCGEATTSRHRGVSWDKRRRRWKATVTVGGRTHHLGRFASEEEAAAVARAFRAEHMPFAAA